MQAAIQSSHRVEPTRFPSDVIDTFLYDLHSAGYAEHTLNKRRWVFSAFARWASREDVTLTHLDDTVVDAFLSRLPGAPADRIQLERGVIRRLLRHLRDRGLVSPAASGKVLASVVLHADFVAYLRHDRGLAENSIQVYGPYVLQYLRTQDTGDGQLALNAFDVTTMRHHLLAQAAERSGEVTRLRAIAQRAFCRFLFLRGKTCADMSESVPSVRKWRQATVPAFITSSLPSLQPLIVQRRAGPGIMQFFCCSLGWAYVRAR